MDKQKAADLLARIGGGSDKIDEEARTRAIRNGAERFRQAMLDSLLKCILGSANYAEPEALQRLLDFGIASNSSEAREIMDTFVNAGNLMYDEWPSGCCNLRVTVSDREGLRMYKVRYGTFVLPYCA